MYLNNNKGEDLEKFGSSGIKTQNSKLECLSAGAILLQVMAVS